MWPEWKKIRVFPYFLIGKPTRKRFSGRPRGIWEKNIRICPKEKMSQRGIGLIRLRRGMTGEPF